MVKQMQAQRRFVLVDDYAAAACTMGVCSAVGVWMDTRLGVTVCHHHLCDYAAWLALATCQVCQRELNTPYVQQGICMECQMAGQRLAHLVGCVLV